MSEINYAEHLGWRVGEDFPEWGNNELYVETIRRGYLLPHETPKQAYERVAFTIAKRLKKPQLEKVFFKYIWDNWLCLASPVLSNVGTERGLPISCYGIDSEDSIRGLGDKVNEMMTLAKSGGGVGIGLSLVRPAGSSITDNGTSDGVVPFCKIYDSAIHSTSQGCYDDQTQLLTEDGWMFFKDLKADTKVAQVGDTSQIYYVNFTDYIEYEVDEELIEVHIHTGRTGKLLCRVTKNHNMPLYTQGKYMMMTAEQLKRQGSFYGAFHRLTSLYKSNFGVTAGSICKQPHSERAVNANFDFYQQHYKGKVYCVTVPTHKLVVRHGEHGEPFICGNSVRRGAAVINLDFEHDDFEEFLEIREPLGDQDRQCLNIHHAAVISDKVMVRLEYMMQGGKPKDAFDERCSRLWLKLLQKRKGTGEPYIIYKGNANKANPPAYKNNSLKVYMSNLCSEILLHTDPEHSFICCLSSLNLARYDEWKDSQLVYHAIWFLDGVLEEFIQRAKYMRGLENTVRSATKGRALGLGVLGWHTFLQQRGLPFCGFTSSNWTRMIFKKIKTESERASKDLAKEYGEPLWCVGTGMRNSHLRAVAPTVSNSKLSGDVSPGIEPITANLYTEQSAKGTFIRKNPILTEVLNKLNLNTQEIWDTILEDNGSVQGIDELDGWVFDFNSELIREEDLVKEHKDNNLFTTVKDVFKTFAEINQLELVKQAAIRQEYIDQGVSLNLKFPTEASPQFINDVHMTAWRLGVKTLYYYRSESVLRGDILTSALDTGCSSCEG